MIARRTARRLPRISRIAGAALGLAILATLATAGRSEAVEGPGDTASLPCRPTIACTADLVVPGALELEAGSVYRSLNGSAQEASFPFLLKLTMARWIQLQVGSNGYTALHGPAEARYLDNVAAGLKFHLVDQARWIPSISLSFTASVPTWVQDGYSRADDVLMTAYASKDFGPLHADFNAGYNRFAVNADPVSQEWLSLSLSTSLPGSFGLMVENYYFTAADPSATKDGGGLVALSYSPASWLVLDAGCDIGYVPSTRAFSVFSGMTVVPVRLWRSD